METSKVNNNTRKRNNQDLNGNSTKLLKTNECNGQKMDDTMYYVCQYCSKIFPKRNDRINHLKTCSAKSYILSVADGFKNAEKEQKKTLKTSPVKVIEFPPGPPQRNNDNNRNNSDNGLIIIKKVGGGGTTTTKTDKFDELLNNNNKEINDKSPPIKLTLRRSPSKDGHGESHFIITKNNQQSSLPGNNNLNNNNNNVLDNNEDNIDDRTCKLCNMIFKTGIEMLRHQREQHKYPKIVMAMSEIQKYYTNTDLSKCPVCDKPLKNNYRSSYLRHLNTHANELTYTCKVCNKKFRRGDHMKQHERRHVIQETAKMLQEREEKKLDEFFKVNRTKNIVDFGNDSSSGGGGASVAAAAATTANTAAAIGGATTRGRRYDDITVERRIVAIDDNI